MNQTSTSYFEAKNDAALAPFRDFEGTRDFPHPEDRLRAVRKASQLFREKLLKAPPVRYYKSVSLIRVPYPSRYALRDAFTLPTPFVHILNRLFIVQFDTAEGVKTALFSPSDIDGNRETPFFKRLSQSFGPLRSLLEPALAPIFTTVEKALDSVGIKPDQVDYISYDHLHTQDTRKWLGVNGEKGYFPNAKLLVMRQEWESTLSLLPPQRDWYCPHGIEGVDPQKVILLDGDTMLGESIALMSSTGHTEGNHSFVVRTPDGLMVTSENGVGPDAYAPQNSRVAGLKKYAKTTGMEVVINGNTLEKGLDQYISMVQEKEVAGSSPFNPDFPNMVCSSEMTKYWLFPGVNPTFNFGDLCYGEPTIHA